MKSFFFFFSSMMMPRAILIDSARLLKRPSAVFIYNLRPCVVMFRGIRAARVGRVAEMRFDGCF